MRDSTKAILAFCIFELIMLVGAIVSFVMGYWPFGVAAIVFMFMARSGGVDDGPGEDGRRVFCSFLGGIHIRNAGYKEPDEA